MNREELRRLAEAATKGATLERYREFYAAANPAAVLDLLDQLDAAEAGLDRVAVAMGCGEEVEGRGVYREDVDGMVEWAKDLLSARNDHDECPQPCHCHDDRLAYPLSCEECKGSGCGPGTASGAYDPCPRCDGSGADCSEGWVHSSTLAAAEGRLVDAGYRAAEDQAEIHHLRDQVSRLTRERDEWEANEQTQNARADAAEARLAAMDDPHPDRNIDRKRNHEQYTHIHT